MQLGFGAGVLMGTPVQTAAGANIANPTPTKFGVLQEAVLDIEFNQKELYGGNQFPVAIGRGQGKITLSAKAAQINGLAWSNLFFGQGTPTPGLIGVFNDVAGELIPATSPYTITVVPPNSGTFEADLGVTNAQGVPLTCVATTPTTGQYEVNLATGVYTFAAADEGTQVFINYTYSATSTAVPGSQNQIVLSELMGYTPTFSVDLSMQYKGQQLNFHLYNCASTKLSLTTKLEDFLIPEFSAAAYANAANQILSWSVTNQ
jgi:hypothetical protein